MSCCLSTYIHTGCSTGFDNPRGSDSAVTGPCSGRSLYRHDTGVPQVAKCPPVVSLTTAVYGPYSAILLTQTVSRSRRLGYMRDGQDGAGGLSLVI